MDLRAKIFDNMSYTLKIMVSFIIILIIPIAISAGVIYQHSVQTLELESKKALQDMLLQKKQEIEGNLDEYEKLAYQIAVYPALTLYFYGTDFSDYDKIDYIYRYINPFSDWIKNFSSKNYDLRVFTSNRAVIENKWIHYLEAVKEEEWLQSALKSSISSPYWESFHGEREFQGQTDENSNVVSKTETSLFIPMMNNYNSMDNTVLELYIKTDVLLKSLEDMVKSQKGAVFVLDSNNQVVYQGPDSMLNLPGLIKENPKIISSAASIERMNIGKDAYFIYQQSVSRLNCRIIGLSPVPEVMKEANKAKDIFVAIFVIIVMVLVFLSFLFSKRLVRQIKILLSAMNRVQNGDMNASVVVSGKDEIALLSHNFNVMITKINNLIRDIYKSEILHKDALLKALENQINPHFMYNTLETIKMMAEIKRERDISDALTSLGSLVRYNISKDRDLVPIGLELEHVRDYFRLQNLMMNDKLKLDTFIEEGVLRLRTLKLVLQPIIENAILHGFDSQAGNMKITIRSTLDGETVKLIIMDNGKGIEPERLEGIIRWINGDSEVPGIELNGNGIGLRNVHKRIQIKFGNDFGLDIDSSVGQWTKITVKIPAIYE